MKRILNKESKAAIELMIANDLITKDIAEKYFPELKESEDERIRKALINGFKDYRGWDEEWFDGITVREAIAWFEKQGEKIDAIENFDTEFEKQVSCLIASAMNRDYEYTKDFVKWTSEGLLNYAKRELEKNSMGISEATKKKLEDSLNEALEKETPESWNKFLDEQGEQNSTNEIGNYDHKKVLQTIINEQNSSWSEEDEETLNTIINHFKVDIECTDEDDIVRWLKSLKDRIQLQPKQKWSKKDIRLLNNCISLIEDVDCTKEEQNFLKSLKNRYTWKPSKEQLHYLYWIANIKLGDSMVEQEVSKHLNELYKQLKQL